ncbi:MAG: TatD family hydrolase [Bacteroidales bacterium]|nr:TatD family hydrolase [Bacteroidales bacterium]
MRFIDTHAHLSDEAFATDAPAAVARAAAAGVFKIIHPDVDSSERAAALALCKEYPKVMYHMIGLYPGSVDKNWEKEMALAEEAIGPETVALGEIGLDYHWSTEFEKEQKLAFRYQMELAAKLGLPVNIHLRDATEDFFKIMDECSHLGVRGNIHAFSGSYETFKRLQKYGDWKVGIGGVLTYKNSKLAVAVKDIPLESILLETDSPYLPPVPHRGERNEPAYIPIVAAKIAEIKGIDIEEVAEATTASATELFSL